MSSPRRGTFRDVAERDVLVLNYTMACPLRCDFCCYGCHPGRKEKFDFEKAKSLISEASLLKNFSSVGFTGGEVFLFEDELIALSFHLKEVALPFTVATAAHWANSEKTAFQLADRLVANGLKRANISFDYSHSKFVPAVFAETAALAFARHGIPVYVVGTFNDATTLVEELLPRIADNPAIEFYSKRIAKVGRATKREVDYGDMDPDQKPDTCYRTQHNDYVIFYDGTAYPCCSTFNRATHGISIGNIYKDSLQTIVSRVHGSLKYTILKKKGLRELYRLAALYDPVLYRSLPDPAIFPGACSLCSAIFKDASLTERLHDVISRYEDDVISASLAWLSENAEKEEVASLLVGLSGDVQRSGPYV